MTLDARLDNDALVDVSLAGRLPAVALEELAAPLGILGTELLDVVKLDIDANGDGALDAATVQLAGAPAPAVFTGWLR